MWSHSNIGQRGLRFPKPLSDLNTHTLATILLRGTTMDELIYSSVLTSQSTNFSLPLYHVLFLFSRKIIQADVGRRRDVVILPRTEKAGLQSYNVDRSITPVSVLNHPYTFRSMNYVEDEIIRSYHTFDGRPFEVGR